nr:AMP-binding protein [Desulfobacterales bacterium]NIW16325.1 AMP-binding protein [Candidatus Bathyarchaeota archaeon]
MAEEVTINKMKAECLFERFYEICKKYPKQTALVYLGEEYSYGQLREAIERFATGLSELGVKKGDRVIIYTSNCPQWVI